MAARAEKAGRDALGRWRDGDPQYPLNQRTRALGVAVQEAVVADATVTAGQDMDHQPPEEIGQRQCALTHVSRFALLVFERDLLGDGIEAKGRRRSVSSFDHGVRTERLLACPSGRDCSTRNNLRLGTALAHGGDLIDRTS